VPGPELVLDVGVVAAALVDVVDDQRDRGARGHLAAGVVLEHSREDAHGVGLAALGGEARLAGPALVEIALDVGFGERKARRAAVDHAADRGPVAFAEAGEAKHMPEGIERHGGFVPRACAGVK